MGEEVVNKTDGKGRVERTQNKGMEKGSKRRKRKRLQDKEWV